MRANNLFLNHESVVTSESTSDSDNAGKAGKITVIAADSVELFANSKLTTRAVEAGGGQIDVDAGNMIYLLDGEITSSVQQGAGNGGDVRTASEFVILNDGDITAKAEWGDGGAIFIKTENYFKSVDSEVSATSKRGNDGTVTIQAPDLDITSGLVTLPATFLDVTRWVETPCAQRSGGSVSRFVVKGWDASPDRADDLRPFGLFWFEEPDEADGPGRTPPPGKWPFDVEDKKESNPDCPKGNC
ncbi:MAG: S-layer family protein [Desulfobacterales bacterium]|nr:S-layer family protein [Desulfobacterales bacterium]